MKKSLLTLAALGAMSSTAMAQTNVTIYGVVDIGLSHDNNGGPAGSVTSMDSGLWNGSRLGFKGTEDLGGGLSANFQIENGFNADTGTLGQGGRIFGRQAWVGLSGGFGAVKFGRQMTPLFWNADTFDPFEDGLAGASELLINYAGDRTDNVISYNYDANGVRAQLQYGLGEVGGNSSAKRTIAGYAGYASGPIDVVLTYTGNNDASGNVTGKTTLLGGNYNFGVVKVFAAYASNKDVTPGGTIAPGADSSNALIGLTAPIGAGTFRASYIRLSDKARNNADANQVAIGYTYDISKRTLLYSSLSRTANDSSVSYNAGAAGATDKLFDVGIRHKF